MKNVWLGIYHYGNHSLTVVSFPLKHTSHLKACRLSHSQYFWIHYYFAQAVISTGNLHLAVAWVCCGNRNQTLFSSLHQLPSSQACQRSRVKMSPCGVRESYVVKQERYYGCQALGTNITLLLVASIIPDIWDSNHTLNGITTMMTALWIYHFTSKVYYSVFLSGTDHICRIVMKEYAYLKNNKNRTFW